MRDAYREIYISCHMKYGLGAPFTERFFDLALEGTPDLGAGFVGLIVANSFMKREFGIEANRGGFAAARSDTCGRLLRRLHSWTRHANGNLVRAKPSAGGSGCANRAGHPRRAMPHRQDPANGRSGPPSSVQAGLAKSESDFVSTEDTTREALARTLGIWAAVELQRCRKRLKSF